MEVLERRAVYDEDGLGGGDAGTAGHGYCAEGYRGPRCELCDGLAHSRYFDKLDARCHDCGDMTARSAAVVCVVLLLTLLAAMSSSPASLRRLTRSSGCNALLRGIRFVRTVCTMLGCGTR